MSWIPGPQMSRQLQINPTEGGAGRLGRPPLAPLVPPGLPIRPRGAGIALEEIRGARERLGALDERRHLGRG